MNNIHYFYLMFEHLEEQQDCLSMHIAGFWPLRFLKHTIIHWVQRNHLNLAFAFSWLIMFSEIWNSVFLTSTPVILMQSV